MNFIIAVLLISPVLFLASCKKEAGCTDPTAINYNPDAEDDCCCVYDSDFAKERYNATINFEHLVNGVELELTNTGFPYQNTLNQEYRVKELKYLISDITFHQENGENFTINDYHYVDFEDPSSLVYQPSIKVPAGRYQSISFTFGFNKEDNITDGYKDLNIINWNWSMPGMNHGYHYMQLNGAYNQKNGAVDGSDTTLSLAIHLGAAMMNHHTFVNNEFDAVLENSETSVNSNFDFTIVMNVEEWFTNPYDWDFDTYNSSIMMDYDAQRLLNLNGPSVFSFKK